MSEPEDTQNFIMMPSPYRGADCVKIEGGAHMARTVTKLVESGVAVMGHVGLTPQSISTLGGFRAQGRTAFKARRVLDDALTLQDAGAFAVVVECVPAIVGAAITDALDVPTIGIGAGPGTDGQVLVYHDLLGSLHHPHHAVHVPKFCKVFADVGYITHEGLADFRDQVKAQEFPSDNFSPYAMPDEERKKFAKSLELDLENRSRNKSEIRESQCPNHF